MAMVLTCMGSVEFYQDCGFLLPLYTCLTWGFRHHLLGWTKHYVYHPQTKSGVRVGAEVGGGRLGGGWVCEVPYLPPDQCEARADCKRAACPESSA